MPQIFHHSTNFLARLSIFGAIFILLAALWVVAEINRSSWITGAFVERYYDSAWLNHPEVHGGQACGAVAYGLMSPLSPEAERWETVSYELPVAAQ